MIRPCSVSALVAGLFVCSGSASAQTCAGRHAFSTANIQLGVSAEVSVDGGILGAEVSAGGENGFFGRGVVTREWIGIPGSTSGGSVYSGAVGYQLLGAGSEPARFCPIASVMRGTFDVAIGQLVRTQFQVGGTIGLSNHPGAISAWVPYAGLAVARMHYDLDLDDGETMSLGSDTYFPLTFGLGLHRPAFALLVETNIPFRLRGSNRSLALRGFIPFSFR